MQHRHITKQLAANNGAINRIYPECSTVPSWHVKMNSAAASPFQLCDVCFSFWLSRQRQSLGHCKARHLCPSTEQVGVAYTVLCGIPSYIPCTDLMMTTQMLSACCRLYPNQARLILAKAGRRKPASRTQTSYALPLPMWALPLPTWALPTVYSASLQQQHTCRHM